MVIRFSFVIPVPQINEYVVETVSKILQFSTLDWEILIVPNEQAPSPWPVENVKVIHSGRVGPGEKRDLAAEHARGDIIVFLDDDSYPNPDFLDQLRLSFDQGAEVVGGPAVTPPEDPFWAQVSGAVFLSRITGGTPERYMPSGPERVVVDWPTVNLSILRSTFLEVGGFECKFWPGEDTFLCDKLTRSGKSILYDPSVVAWHHRRRTLRGHLRQVGGYGLHRGYFARHYAESSRKFMYFLPTLLVCYLVLGAIVAAFIPNFRLAFLASIAAYLLIQIAALWVVGRKVGWAVAGAALPYSVLTHCWYGVRFIKGFLMTPPLVSKLR